MKVRRREKPLTPKEAIELARKELAQDWIGSEPLLAAVPTKTGAVTAYPLGTELSERPWLVFFLDPTEFSMTSAQSFAKEWAHRYEPQKLGVLIIVRARYSFVLDRAWLGQTPWMTPPPNLIVTAVDRGGLLFSAFGVNAENLPKVIFLDHGQRILEQEGTDWFKEIELRMQQAFRKNDVGLPLPPPLPQPEVPERTYVTSFELGGEGAIPEAIDAQGKWNRDQEKIWTNDPSATLSFDCAGASLGLVARSIQRETAVEIHVEPSSSEWADTDLHFEGHLQGVQRHGTCRIGHARIYSVLKNLPPNQRRITLRFPHADRIGVELFGLRFGA